MGVGLETPPSGSDPLRNTISGNAIHSNGGLGIDLGADGVTANDLAPDADGGPNALQNYPVLTSAFVDGTTSVLAGTLTGAPSTVYALEIFASQTLDPTGHGEGQRFLGVATATTDAAGTAMFNVVLAASANPGEFITATATDPSGNTSEFSASVQAISSVPVLSLDPDDSSGQGGTDFAAAFVEGAGPVGIADSDAVIVDADSVSLSSMNVQITNLLDGALGSADCRYDRYEYHANYNSASGVLTLIGWDSIANYNQVLQTVSYENLSVNGPDTTPRSIQFRATDGTHPSELRHVR